MSPTVRSIVCSQRRLPLLALAAALTACGSDIERESTVTTEPAAEPYEVEIHIPSRLEGLDSQLTDIHGNTVTVSCATCHEGRELPQIEHADELEQFHAGLEFAHGPLTCGSCHDEDQRDYLHLADGSQVALEDAMSVCAQCHGPQVRDYTNGSHGGMTGYWDLSRGPRARNHCVDCHDPHSPAFPMFEPMPAPRDRFLEPATH